MIYVGSYSSQGAPGIAVATSRNGILTIQSTASDCDEPGTHGWELCLPVEDSADETVIHKATDDGFQQTGLAELLAARGVRSVAICGVMSEMRVSATARTALTLGLKVVLPHNAHATYDIPAAPGISAMVPAGMVSRVAEWALGDEVNVVADAADVDFLAPTK